MRGRRTTTIGGTTAADRNLISGNPLEPGRRVTTSAALPAPTADASRTVIQGNFIGTDRTGTSLRQLQPGTTVIGRDQSAATIAGAGGRARIIGGTDLRSATSADAGSTCTDQAEARRPGQLHRHRSSPGPPRWRTIRRDRRITGGRTNSIGGTAAGAGNVLGRRPQLIGTSAADIDPGQLHRHRRLRDDHTRQLRRSSVDRDPSVVPDNDHRRDGRRCRQHDLARQRPRSTATSQASPASTSTAGAGRRPRGETRSSATRSP